MLTTLAGGMLAAALAAAPQTDTTFAVQAGARLEVRNTGGEIAVRTWDRNAVRIEAEHSSRTRVEVQNSGSVVAVRATSRYGPANIVDYRITVPASMRLDLSGMYSDIRVEGSQGEVSAQTVQGEISIRGGRGNVTARSVQGEVSVEGAQGEIRAHATSGEVRIANSSGEISAESMSGDIVLERISSGRVEAATVSGDVFYEGTVQDRGRYAFVTHSGDLVASIPQGANVAGSVATLNGDLESSFSFPFGEEGSGRRYTFNMGSGSAQMELETFSGDIELRRPEEVRTALAEWNAERARRREREESRERGRAEPRPRPAPAPPRPPRP